MSGDDFDAALEECVRETGVERYRHLAGEANTETGRNSAAEYRRWIVDRGWRRPAPAVDYQPAVGGGGCGGCR